MVPVLAAALIDGSLQVTPLMTLFILSMRQAPVISLLMEDISPPKAAQMVMVLVLVVGVLVQITAITAITPSLSRVARCFLPREQIQASWILAVLVFKVVKKLLAKMPISLLPVGQFASIKRVLQAIHTNSKEKHMAHTI